MKVFVSALVIAAPLVAAAGGKPGAAKDHTPPLVVDESGLTLEAVQQGSEGYYLRARFGMIGLTADSDIVRMEIKQKGKVLATKQCSLEYDGGWGWIECYASDKKLTAVGALDVDLIYFDDKTEKEYLVRTLKTSAVHMKGQWDTWGIVPDDTLAGGWIRMGNADRTDSTYRRPTLYAWFGSAASLGNAKLRCTAAGKKLEDISVSEQGGSDTEEVELDYAPKKGERQSFLWAKKKLMPDIFWGQRDTLSLDRNTNTKPDGVLSDNPGAWECFLRINGKNIRQISFNVDKDGMIQPDEIQTGKNPIPAVPNVVFVDVRPTKDASSWDKHIAPDAFKKSLQYGLPWPEHAKVKTIQASFPPKSGFPDPK